LYYYDYAKKWGMYSDEDFRLFVSVGIDIVSRLQQVFAQEENHRNSHGGPFDIKSAFLFLLIRKFKPRIVVETGVAQGGSSYVMLKALQINGVGKLISVDLESRNPEGYAYSDGTRDPVYVPKNLTVGWLVPDELRSFWALKLGRSSKVLPTIDDDIDFFYHDSEHSYENMTFEFEWAYAHLKEGGMLAADDVGWNRAFPDFLQKHGDMRPLVEWGEFPSLIKVGRHDEEQTHSKSATSSIDKTG